MPLFKMAFWYILYVNTATLERLRSVPCFNNWWTMVPTRQQNLGHCSVICGKWSQRCAVTTACALQTIVRSYWVIRLQCFLEPHFWYFQVIYQILSQDDTVTVELFNIHLDCTCTLQYNCKSFDKYCILFVYTYPNYTFVELCSTKKATLKRTFYILKCIEKHCKAMFNLSKLFVQLC